MRKKKLEQLTEKQFDYLTEMHRRVFVNGNFNPQRFREFERKVEKFRRRGYNVSEFERYICLYHDNFFEEMIERR